jgi:hypothetical protein
MLVAMLPSLSKGRPTQEIKSANLPTYPEKAEKANVSERTIRDASTVVSDGSPALSKAVLDGKIPVSTAAKITELPKAEQNKLAEQGKVAVAQAAKRIVTKAEYEADAGTLTDQKKHVVPANKPEIVKAFQRRGEIVELMNTLSKIKHQVLKAIEEKDVLYVGITTSDWQGTVGHAREILKFQAPYVVCPMCNAQGNCRMCKDRGWITESQYAAVPRELKS